MEAQVARAGLADLKRALYRSRAEELDELNRAHRPARHRSLVSAWASAWLRRPPEATHDPIPTASAGELSVTFGGHATVVLGFPHLQVAVNPMLGARLGLVPRVQAAGVSADALSACDLILITHPAPEFLHHPTLSRLPASATVIVPSRCAGLVSRHGFARVVELGIGSSLSHRGVDVTACAVRHRGPACAYVLRGDGPSVFYCGASGYFSGFADVGGRFRPDIALLPISGYSPRSFRDDNMSPLDALYAFEDLAARMFIPIRHGAFILSYERLEEPLRWLESLVSERDLDRFVTPLTAGTSRKFMAPPQ
jgi:L-ascorbate metabolism protein UlaG (beta-lactamase superfamily)